MRTPPRSLWWSTLDSPVVPRPAVASDLDVDVAIVGGGYTGLWTARELARRNPTLQIAVLEHEVCGFGASGRNGGWASALYPVSFTTVAATHGAPAAERLRTVLQRAVGELGDAARTEGIAADYHQGGSLTFARNSAQVDRLKGEVASAQREGRDRDLVWLDAAAARERANVANALGATFTPHCARIHPAKLVRGLADACSRLGVAIYEGTAVRRIQPATNRHRARALTMGGVVRADIVVRATEGFTATLPRERRRFIPLYSLMVATDVLDATALDDVGFEQAETFSDGRHLIIYGQRTADGRIAFGGRGAPYHFGSAVEPRFDDHGAMFTRIERTLRDLLPGLTAPITHCWGGPLAMPRDHEPTVLCDHRAGLAVAGGYTGDGVVLSYVAARALADLITDPGTPSDDATLPFVSHQGRKWELEPLRWAGINAGLTLAGRADAAERRGGPAGRAARALERILG